MLITVLIATILLACIMHYFLHRLLRHCLEERTLHAIPSPPVGSTILGHTQLAFHPGNQHLQLRTWSDHVRSGIYRLRFGWKKVIILNDPMLVAKLFDQEKILTKGPAYRHLTNLSSSVGTPNLVSVATHDPQWRMARKGLAPAFATSNTRRICPIASACTKTALARIKHHDPDQPIDMDRIAIQIAVDVIGKWAFDADLGVVEEHPSLWPKEDIVQLLDDALVESNARMVIPAREWHVLWSSQARSGAACLRTLTSLFDRLAQHCVARYGADGPPAGDACFMAQLLRIRDACGKALSWDQIVTQVGIAIVAGHDTTGHTIAFSLMLLCQHPDRCALLLKELEAHGLVVTANNPNPRTMVYDDLPHLPYLQAVVKETLRLYPVIPALGRVLQPGYSHLVLGGHTIPAHIGVAVCLYSMHRRYFEHGDQFMPERWLGVDNHAALLPTPPHPAAVEHPDATNAPKSHPLEEEGGLMLTVSNAVDGVKTPITPASRSTSNASALHEPPTKRYMPFSDGPRDCIGQPLARLTVPATLATLLGHLEFSLAPFDGSRPPRAIADERLITLRPVPADGKGKGLPLYVRCRTGVVEEKKRG